VTRVTTSRAPKVGLRERNRLRTRGDITAAALELFLEQGYDATTVDQIASSAAVSTATFFRYFAFKEDVLFADEDAGAEALVEIVAARPDRSRTVTALAGPLAEFAASMVDGTPSNNRLLTRLVMTTRALEARSLRLRLRWERVVAHQLAVDDGRTTAALEDTLIAAVAVSCLTSALRHWEDTGTAGGLTPLVEEAFVQCVAISAA
jgi:AcrR family transcriptional regulator